MHVGSFRHFLSAVYYKEGGQLLNTVKFEAKNFLLLYSFFKYVKTFKCRDPAITT